MDEDSEPPLLNTSKSKKSDEGEGRKKLKTEIESPTSTERAASNDTPTTSKRRRKTSNEKEAAPPIKKEEEVVVEERVKHEPDKCPVCLQAFSSAHSKAYASNCFHAFDFECLLEWSKVRQQCPLCKTNFDRIIYNVLSRLEFNEFALKPKESEPTQDVIPIYPENEARRSLAEIRAPESWVVKCEPAPTSFRKLVYREKWYASPYQTASYVRTTNIELEIGDELNGATTSSSNVVTSENLECVAYKPVTQKRDVSPEFLTENPAKLMRLGQFMQRELRAIKSLRDSLNGSDTSTINFILDDPLDRNRRDELINMLLRLIQTKRIDSDEFLKETKSYFKTLKFKQNDRLVQVERRYQLARHFQHELLTFASSKFETLVEYDAHCVYYKDLESIPGPKDRHKSDKTPISRSLPIILTAYKYTSHPRPNLIPSQPLRLNSFRPINFMQPLQMLTRLQTQYTQQERMPITVEDDHENEEDDRVEEVFSDQSSFCEELTPPPKKQPDLIDLISSSDESLQEGENTHNNRQSRSRSRSTRSSGQSETTKSRSGSSRRKHRHREKKSKKSSKRHKSGKKKKRNRS